MTPTRAGVRPVLPLLLSVGLTAATGGTAARGGEPLPDAEAVVESMVEAHGGMAPWLAAPTVSFTDRVTHGTSNEARSSRVTVERTSRRVLLDMVGSDARMAWDGERAWSLNWTQRVPPRFLAQLDFYFLCLPWLTRDPGVRLGDPEWATVHGDSVISVRMTFDPGTGDTPDDYYLLYIDPTTRRLRGCEYVVTYADLLPPGVKHTPPHDLLYTGYTQVGGLLVPTGYTIEGKDGSPLARSTVTDWSFTRPFDVSALVMPQGAVVDTTRPRRGSR